MSLSRVLLAIIEALFNELACTPPNRTLEKDRYDTDTPSIFRIGSLMFRIHNSVLRFCVAFEIYVYLTSLPAFPASSFSPFSASETLSLYTTPLFLVGVIAVILGACIRISCFHELGELFTFDLTIHPRHHLITSGLYAKVRHPALQAAVSPRSGPLIGAFWWLWMFGIGLNRAKSEDRQMRALFTEEWDAYAARVPYWLIPGVI
ncbi:hypothetical protein DFH08DRAFT_927966 [Mycena albidolilacea]|uniref:Protein-S-isoprenylcysteine O-methyltransferase n=1 Tax=Mycena albidolilacea TaxID=1033008 RepID=A0AAD6YW40_9AGAR|nr:hypothetical protein DFH08DRAFT_927966 [Mycena albidolilacea]